jgi:hypothetical protein
MRAKILLRSLFFSQPRSLEEEQDDDGDDIAVFEDRFYSSESPSQAVTANPFSEFLSIILGLIRETIIIGSTG